MSQTKARAEKESGKKHGDALETAMHEADAHTIESKNADPIPPAENGVHAKSSAAHLGGAGDPHTKLAGNLRQGSHPGALREPPMVVQRVGKQHKGGLNNFAAPPEAQAVRR